MNSCQRLSIFTSLVMFVSALSLVIASVMSDYWFESNPVNDKAGASQNNFIHSGLLKGSRQLDWGLGPRYKPFSVYEEIHDGYSFLSKTPWIFMLFFLALGSLWNVIGIIICLVNTVVRQNETVAGPVGIYLWSVLSLISYGSGVIVFLFQYFTSIKNSVLLAEQIEGGFSTVDRTRLGFSFYLQVVAMGILLIPGILMFVTADRSKRPRVQKHIPQDDTVFMY